MGETTIIGIKKDGAFPSATFDETVVETSPEIEATKASIEHTRADMSETINAIKEQLSPKRLVAEAKEAVSEAVAEKAHEAQDAIMDKVSDVAHGASDIVHNVVASVTGAAHSIGDKVSELAGNAKDKVNEITGGAKDKMDTLTHSGSHTRTVTLGATTYGGSRKQFSGDMLMDVMKENPIPTALVGLGLGWLLVDAIIKSQNHDTAKTMSSSAYTGSYSAGYTPTPYAGGTAPTYTSGTTPRNNLPAYTGTPSAPGIATGAKAAFDQAGDRLHETGEHIGEAIDDAKAKVIDTAHDLQAKAADLAGDVRQKAGETTALVQTKATQIGETTQQSVRRAADATQDFVTGNPLAAGAIALAVGTIVGLMLPSTAPENKFMGTYRDQLADEAGKQAQGLMNKVQTVAGDAVAVVKDELIEGKDSVKEQMTQAMDKVQTQFAEAKDKVQSVVETSAKASKLVPA